MAFARQASLGMDVYLRYPDDGQVYHIGQAREVTVRSAIDSVDTIDIHVFSGQKTPVYFSGHGDCKYRIILAAAILMSEDECITYTDRQLELAKAHDVQSVRLEDEKATILTLTKNP